MTDVLDPPAAALLASSLESLDPAEVEARNRALAAMSALAAPGLRIRASLAEPLAGPWIQFGSDPRAPRLAIVDLDGARFAVADDAALLVALDRFEPLLVAIEAATGLTLEPSDISRAPAPPGPGLALALEVRSEEDAAPSRLVFQVDPALVDAWTLPAIDLDADGAHLAVPIAGALVLEAAAVAAARVATLRVGDIVLTPWGPGRPGEARLTLSGRRLIGRFDPGDQRFTVFTLEEIAMAAPPTDAVLSPEISPAEAAPIAPADLPVSLRVMLGEVSLPLSELARLRPGSTVVLSGPARDAAAILLAGERPIATGRLVTVGEAYGLLIEHLATGA